MLMENHLKVGKNKHSQILMVLALFLISISVNGKLVRCEDKLLLIYAQIENNNTSVMDSTEFFNDTFCLKIKIDTIKVKRIVKIKGNKDAFTYNGITYKKNQLFPISKYNNLLKFEIKRFNVSTIQYRDVRNIAGEGNCLNLEQKQFIYNIYKSFQLKDEFLNEKLVYIDNIQLFNGIDHFIEFNYGSIKFN